MSNFVHKPDPSTEIIRRTDDASAPLLTRRELLKASLLASIGALAAPAAALAAPQDDLEEAKKKVEMTEAQIKEAEKKLAAAEEQLEELASEIERLSKIHAETLTKIDSVKADIAEIEKQIEEKEAELAERQEILSARVSSAYKSGPASILQLLFRASTFEEFSSNVYYLDKISESDHELIEGIKEVRAELEEKRKALEDRKAELEDLSAKEEEQLAEMRVKQEAVGELIASLDEDVRTLMAQKEEDLLAQAEAEQAVAEEKRKAAAAAAAGTPALAPVPDLSNVSGSQASVISACYRVPTPGGGLCAMWVSQVFSAAGYGYVGGDACDMYSNYCYTSDLSAIQPGMIVACSTHPHTWAGRIWGHVGIYIGDGTVMDNVGYIRTISLSEWIDYYGATVPVRWGWLGGMVLA